MYYVKLYIIFLLMSCMIAHYNSIRVYHNKNGTFADHPHLFSVTCTIYGNLFIQFFTWIGYLVASTTSHMHDLMSTLFGGVAMLVANYHLSRDQDDYKVLENNKNNEAVTWVNYNYQRKIKLTQNIGVILLLDYVITVFVCQDRRRCAE